MWATPVASENANRTNAAPPSVSDGRGHGVQLAAQVKMWSTPAASAPQDGESPETWRARQKTLAEKGINGNGAGVPLAIQAKEHVLATDPTHPLPMTSTDGVNTLPSTLVLNPRFVEALMGVPLGWLSCEPVETESFRRWRRSRGVIFGAK